MKITGILNNVFRPPKKTPLKETRIKLYNTLALPVLLYGSETWTVKASDARRITAAEVEYMTRIHLDRLQKKKRTNCNGVKNNTNFGQITVNWVQYVNRMPRNRLPRIMKY